MCVCVGGGGGGVGVIHVRGSSMNISAHNFPTQNVEPPIVDTPKSGQPPYNGQTACPLLYACFNLRRRDYLKTLVPIVSIVRRFHFIMCIQYLAVVEEEEAQTDVSLVNDEVAR